MLGTGQCPLLSPQTSLDLGRIFRDLGDPFLEGERLTNQQKRVFRRIAECRTAAMGGCVYQCRDCGRYVGVYHSCRDRHCPQCQEQKTAEWVDRRLDELIPVPSFHVVFTLPHELNALIVRHQKSCLNLLFRAASQTLMAFARDEKYLGATPGIVMILHTWGQKLNLHYHVHCIVTAGGLSADRLHWQDPPNPSWLFPISALRRVFKGKFLTGLDDLREKNLLPHSHYSDGEWAAFKRCLAHKKWNLYAKPPFAGPKHLIKYLAQYTHRIAITNSRIRSYKSGRVTFRYKDYTHRHGKGYRIRQLELDARIFARRFLLHVLPKGFIRIRYYGLYSSRNKKEILQDCRRILILMGRITDRSDASPVDTSNEVEQSSEVLEPEGHEKNRSCPYCKNGRLQQIGELSRWDKHRARCLLWDTS